MNASRTEAPGRVVGSVGRLAAALSVALLHMVAYYLVVRSNARQPASAFLDVATAPDRWIPYLPWTWVVYYFGDLYIVLWGGYLFWRVPDGRIGRTALAYGVMIVVGALLQVALPVRAPWPDVLHASQRWMNRAIALRPYACLPSMHVALTVLPAGIALTVLRESWLRRTSALLAALITISTLTFKQHYAVDALAGALLGLGAYAYWGWGGGVPRARH